MLGNFQLRQYFRIPRHCEEFYTCLLTFAHLLDSLFKNRRQLKLIPTTDDNVPAFYSVYSSVIDTFSTLQ